MLLLWYKCNRDQWKTRPTELTDGEWIGNPAEAAAGYGAAGFDRNMGGRRGSRSTGIDRCAFCLVWWLQVLFCAFVCVQTLKLVLVALFA